MKIVIDTDQIAQILADMTKKVRKILGKEEPKKSILRHKPIPLHMFLECVDLYEIKKGAPVLKRKGSPFTAGMEIEPNTGRFKPIDGEEDPLYKLLDDR